MKRMLPVDELARDERFERIKIEDVVFDPRNATFRQNEQSPAFVMMEYFGYLRRDPSATPDSDLSGYNFWLNKLNAFGGNYIKAEMVKAFITSTEYRQRFGQ